MARCMLAVDTRDTSAATVRTWGKIGENGVNAPKSLRGYEEIRPSHPKTGKEWKSGTDAKTAVQGERLTLAVSWSPPWPGLEGNSKFDCDISKRAGLDGWYAPKLAVARAPLETHLENVAPHKSGQRCAGTARRIRIQSESSSEL